jgi:hypothetical protein
MMKLNNLKAKVAVVALALSSALPASAALTNTDGGNSSLMLTVWNGTVSYTRNLGTTLSGFLTSYGDVSSHLFAGDSVFTTAFGTTAATALNWNIVAGDNLNTGSTNPAQTLVTGPQGGGLDLFNGATIGIANANINTQMAFMNSACGAASSCTVAAGANGDGGATGWSNLNAFTFETAGIGAVDAQSVPVKLAMYLFASNASGPGANGATTQFSVNGQESYWTLDAATGNVTWNVASVPVPAAVWLLGSGLLGLIGVGRRKAALVA